MDYISKLFSDFVTTYEVSMKNIDGELYPQEAVLISTAVEKRKKEFTAGRLCAKVALSELGIYNFPVLANKDRSPIWPLGIAGSISHTNDYCGVALAKKDEIQSIGLDIEVINEVKEDYTKIVCSKDEIDWLFQWSSQDRQKFLTLIFSAKECFYKFQYPLTKKWVGFKDIKIDIEGCENCVFKVTLLKDISKQFEKSEFFRGNYFMNDRCVFTGMSLARS